MELTLTAFTLLLRLWLEARFDGNIPNIQGFVGLVSVEVVFLARVLQRLWRLQPDIEV